MIKCISNLIYILGVIILSGCLFGIPRLYKMPKNSDFKYFGITPVIDSISSLDTRGVYVCEVIYKNMPGKIFYEFQPAGKLNMYGYYHPDEPNIEIVNKIETKLYTPDYFGYFIAKKDTIFLEYVFPEKTAALNVWYRSFGKVHLNGDSLNVFRIEGGGKRGAEDMNGTHGCSFIKF